MRRSLALVLLCTAQFMTILDTTIVNVALPVIRTDLEFGSQASLQYVISLYALTYGGSLILAGRLADIVGRRRIFVIGLVTFVAASLLCGLATLPGVLLAGRTVQGLGSAMISSAALALLTTMFAEGAERNRALGAWGAVGGAAGASGLILGGVLTDALGWEAVFLINIPIGVMAVAAARPLLPANSLRPVGPRIRRARPSPPVGLRLLRLPGIAEANVAAVLLMTAIASNLFFTTLYTQQVLGFSAWQTGLAFLPNSILAIIGSAAASRLAARIGPPAVLASGLAIVCVGALLLSMVSANGTYLVNVLPGFALTGLGLGMSFVAITIGATTGVDESSQGLAAGILNTAQQIGFAAGIAAVVAIAEHRERITGDAIAGYATGYLIGALVVAAGVLLAITLWTRRRRAAGLPGSTDRPEPVEPSESVAECGIRRG